MVSGSIQPSAANMGVVLQNPQNSTTASGGGGGGGESSGSSFTGITDPAVYAILLQALQSAAGGGDADYKAQRAERNTEIQRTRALSGDYTKNAAFADAADLMAQQLRQSLEANMPAISKSIQGAGTSASSMQGLLSQKLATESAQAAGALGAKQATDYGQISGVLQGILERLTVPDNSNMQALAQLLNVAKTSSQTQRSVTNPTNPTIAGESTGGGTYFQPFADQGGDYGQAIQQAVKKSSSGPSGGYAVDNTTGIGTQWKGGQENPIFVDPYSYQAPAYNSPYDYGPQLEEEPLWGYGD